MWLDLFLMRLVVLAVGGLVAFVGGWCAGGWCNAGGGLWWCWDGTGARLAELRLQSCEIAKEEKLRLFPSSSANLIPRPTTHSLNFKSIGPH